MKEFIDKQVVEKLLKEGKSYKEIVEITGYKKNSVYGFCWRNFGKLEDRNRSRRQKIEITQEQKEVIFGTLLGDGNLQKVINSYQGRTNHCLAQFEYCSLKQNLLNNLTYPVNFTEVTLKKYPGKIYKQCYFCFKPNEYLEEFYILFYNGKKDVPLDLSYLTPRALAFWFMDDGSADGRCTISIATCSFTQEGLQRLQTFLKETYNLEVHINKEKKLYFTASSGRLFYSLVLPYMHSKMMYKFKYINTAKLI